MNNRILAVAVVLGVVLLAFAFVLIPTGMAAAGLDSAHQPDATGVNLLESVIQAARIISIPYGIDEPLTLAGDGRQIHVTGLTQCPEGVDTHEVRVIASQDSTGARAFSRLSEPQSCTGEIQFWAVDALALGQASFEPGGAEICTIARFSNADGGFGGLHWCYQAVTLE
jgi:hypothetical protein